MSRKPTRQDRDAERGRLTKAYRASVRRRVAETLDSSLPLRRFADRVRGLSAEGLIEAARDLAGEPEQVRLVALRLASLRFGQLRKAAGRDPFDDGLPGEEDDGWIACRDLLSVRPNPAPAPIKRATTPMLTLTVQINDHNDLNSLPKMLAGLGAALAAAAGKPTTPPAGTILAPAAVDSDPLPPAPAAAGDEGDADSGDDDTRPVRGARAEALADELIAEGTTSGPQFDRLPKKQQDRVRLQVEGDNSGSGGGAEADGDAVPSPEDLAAALTAVAKHPEGGPAKLREILQSVGAERMSAIPEDKRAEAIAAAKQVTG